VRVSAKRSKRSGPKPADRDTAPSGPAPRRSGAAEASPGPGVETVGPRVRDAGIPARMATRERWALALLATGTAVFLPLALNRFVFPKFAVVAAGVLLATTVPARGRLPRSAVAILSVGALVLLAAALAGSTPVAQLLGRPPRYEGIFVLPVYVGAGVAGARLLGPGRARGSTAWFLRWLSIAALAIGVEAALEATGLRPLASSVARPGSLLGNASDEGAWAVLALGPLTAVALRVGGRLYIAGALAAAVTLVCSGSRGALLGAIAVAVILVVLAPHRALRIAIACGMAAIAVGVFALPATRARVTGTSPLAEQTARGRELLWGETLRLIDAHPLLGVGPSGYLDAIPVYHDRRYELEVGPANPPDGPHNWILQAAADGGVLLALLALALAGLTLQRGLRAAREQITGGEAAVVGGMLAGLVGYGVALLFHLTSPGTTPLAAVLGGALLADPRPVGVASRQRAPIMIDAASRAVRRPTLRAAQLALAALVIVLAAAALAEIPLRSAIDAVASGDFATANADFRTAHALRPWDGEIAATAAHAYATLVVDGISSAAAAGTPWAAKELAAYPNSIQALADSATLDLARHRPAIAARLLSTALKRDPANPELHTQAGEVALAEHDAAAAIEFLRAASILAPDDGVAWHELGIAYLDAGQTRQASIAARRARQLTK
jgi:O-antigen ligase